MADIRPLAADDEAEGDALLANVLGSRVQARLGELLDVLAFDGFGVWGPTGELVGVATYRVEGPRVELVALAVGPEHRRRGVGSQLIEAVATVAASRGAQELWLVTTNDNLDALGLYQRRGFRLSALHPGGVDRSRRLKPSIPSIGEHGIPLRDELVLSRTL